MSNTADDDKHKGRHLEVQQEQEEAEFIDIDFVDFLMLQQPSMFDPIAIREEEGSGLLSDDILNYLALGGNPDSEDPNYHSWKDETTSNLDQQLPQQIMSAQQSRNDESASARKRCEAQLQLLQSSANASHGVGDGVASRYFYQQTPVPQEKVVFGTPQDQPNRRDSRIREEPQEEVRLCAVLPLPEQPQDLTFQHQSSLQVQQLLKPLQQTTQVPSPVSRLPMASAGAVATRSTKRRTRDPNHPKQPLSAYNFFFKHERARMLGEDLPCIDGESSSSIQPPKKRSRITPHRKVTFENMAKQIGKKWKELDTGTSRAIYQALADTDRDRYDMEMIGYKERIMQN
jgi:hypothetical protein